MLRRNDYHLPERTIDVVSGLGTILASFLGPVAVSLSFPATALVSGPDAGEHRRRHWALYVVSAAGLMIALVSGMAASLASIIPQTLLMALAGLALLGLFIRSLQEMTKGPVLLGPIFAFVITFSGVSLFGFGSFFWALVIGLGVSMLLERRELAADPV
ncbi:hypothetical protein BH23ACT5_BH23ACT5_11060 [soil metagenome]